MVIKSHMVAVPQVTPDPCLGFRPQIDGEAMLSWDWALGCSTPDADQRYPLVARAAHSRQQPAWAAFQGQREREDLRVGNNAHPVLDPQYLLGRRIPSSACDEGQPTQQGALLHLQFRSAAANTPANLIQFSVLCAETRTALRH